MNSKRVPSSTSRHFRDNASCDRMNLATPITPSLGQGVYTLPDAALILGLPLTRLRSWVGGYIESTAEDVPMLATWGKGRGRGFNFHVLVEAYTVYNLRQLGVSLQKIRTAREVLSGYLKTPHPFAAHGILASGGKVLFDLPDSFPKAALNLNLGKQTELSDIIEPFCKRLDFNEATLLAERFWPRGHHSHIVVDPQHAFGRPIIEGTNITVEALADLVDAGEDKSNIASQYSLPLSAVEESHDFIHQLAA